MGKRQTLVITGTTQMEIKNFGICGACTQVILEKELPQAKKFAPTLAIVLAGTNDCGNPNALHCATDVQKSYEQLILGLKETGAEIILMTLPPVIEEIFVLANDMAPWGGMYPSERIGAVNKVIRALAEKHSCHLLDLNEEYKKYDLEQTDSVIRNASNGGGDDGCHMTDNGYSLMGYLAYRKILEIKADTSRTACLGDSLTYGAYASSGEGTAQGFSYPGRLALFLQKETRKAKKISDDLKKSVVYQLFLRAFSPEGTFKGAQKLLHEAADTGSDILYLCPIVKADSDPRKEFWSARQKRSLCNNPKSPYRIEDYFLIDPEYGTGDDFSDFVRTAHSLGMKVMLDLVYYHCGPSLAAKHPEFVRKNADGTPLNGEWSFPQLDFNSQALRKHLTDNMLHFVEKFGIDGYRCDVGGKVPLDFWQESAAAVRKIKPSLIMLCESETERPEDQLDVFDMNYSFTYATCAVECMNGLYSAQDVRRKWLEVNHRALDGARFLRAFDNHDIANDVYMRRFENVWGASRVECAFLLNFTLDGIPFIYNGYEVNDTNRHSIFANKGQFTIDRSKANPERMKILRTLTDLRRAHKPLWDGETLWLDNTNNDHIISFIRKSGNEEILVLLNPTGAKRLFRIENTSGNADTEKILLQRGFSQEKNVFELEPYGFAVTGGN